MIIRNVLISQPSGERLWSGIQLLILAKSRRHHFNKKHIEGLQQRGFAEINQDEIVLKTIDGDMKFKIDHNPGCFCLHCEEEIPYEYDLPAGHENKGAQARAHVAKEHGRKVSPNVNIPAGYKLKGYYGVTADSSVPGINPNAHAIVKRMGVSRHG